MSDLPTVSEIVTRVVPAAEMIIRRRLGGLVIDG
jgi:hypothetical protein